jgi:hypothetical protein
LFPIDH